jgi:hypothetical protein
MGQSIVTVRPWRHPEHARARTGTEADPRTLAELKRYLSGLSELRPEGLVPDPVPAPGEGGLALLLDRLEETGRAPALEAMESLVTHAASGEDAARRFDELVDAGVAAFNQGALARAGAVFALAGRLLDDGAVDPGRVESLRTGHERLDPERLRRVLDGQERDGLARGLLRLFRVFDPEAVLDRLGLEPERERRGLLLAFLEAHGARGRQAACDRLRSGVVEPVDAYLARNLVRLLRRIPPDGDPAPGAPELARVVRLLVPENPPLLVREVLAYLTETRHAVAEQVLARFLSTLEEILLAPPAGAGEDAREKWLSHLDETAAALARHGSPRARAVLVEHGLRTEPELGGAAERLSALGRFDLSGQPELVGRLLGACRAELPSGFFARPGVGQSRRLLGLVSALAGSVQVPGVRETLELVAARFSEEEFGRRAAAALKAPLEERLADSRTRASLSGSLTVFGLPTLLQSLADQRLSGELTVLDPDGSGVATLGMDRGQLCHARHGALRGADAVYQLLERPVRGSFFFVDRSHEGEKARPLPPMTALLLEGLRRQDELRRAVAVVPDDARLVPTGRAPRAAPGEDDIDLLTTVWEKAVGGATPRDCEGGLAFDAYRVRRCLARWVEEGALRPAGH